MPNSLDERDWQLLLDRIADGKCAPLLGPGLSAGIIPQRTEIAESWAHQYEYPLADSANLAQVSQYLAVQFDPLYPKEKINKQLAQVSPPDFNAEDEPHAILADLNLPIYITTNYDDFMFQALRSRKKDPVLELCQWNQQLQRSEPSALVTGYSPSPANPLVYHLHGHSQNPSSLVLTEDDYIDFLVNISGEEYELPPIIQRAISGSSLLMVGYSPVDWDFRVLFRGVVAAAEAGLRRISVTVQMPPVPEGTPTITQEKVQEYMNEYFDMTDRRLRVYWGTAQEFMAELRRRWLGIQQEQKAGVSGNGSTAPVNLISLLSNLTESFSKSELHTIAFELRVDYENLPEAKDGFARELIVYLQRRKRLHELLELGQRERPHIEW